jgi:uncharacterized membrane protein SpoIIM required for sporulation
MNVPSITAILIIGVMVIYLAWKLMAPAKKKPEQKRFSIRKHRKKYKDEEDDDNEN